MFCGDLSQRVGQQLQRLVLVLPSLEVQLPSETTRLLLNLLSFSWVADQLLQLTCVCQELPQFLLEEGHSSLLLFQHLTIKLNYLFTFISITYAMGFWGKVLIPATSIGVDL